MRALSYACVCVVVVLGGCSDDAAGPASPETPTETEPAAEPSPVVEDEVVDIEGSMAMVVDLLRSAPSEVVVSSAYHDDTEQVGRLTDGDLETAWNSRTGELGGAWIAFRVPEDALVQAIQMTAGFTKTDGARDLFTGNHRVRRVRVINSDGLSVERDLDVESRELQTIPVAGAGGDWKIELVDVQPGSNASWREACVSELRVQGTMAGARGGELTPRGGIGTFSDGSMVTAEAGVDGIDDDGGDGDDGDDDSPPGVDIAEREGLHISAIVLARGVESREAVDPGTTFSKAADERVYCLVKLDNPERTETEISIGWESVDPPTEDPGRPSAVRAMPHWTTFAYTGTRRRAGRYQCVVRDADGEVLGRAEFELTD